MERRVVDFVKSSMCDTDFHVFPKILEGNNTTHSKIWHDQVNHSFQYSIST